MQPQAPIKNYIFFFASVLALMFGWNSFKAWKWPPPQPKEIVWPLEKLPNEHQATMIARLGAAATGRGLADIVDVTTQYRMGPYAAKAPTPAWPYQTSTRKEQDAAIARMALSLTVPNSPADVAQLAAACQLNQRVIAEHADAAQPGETFTLGGEGYPITATLTSQGAGVQELVLNDFPGVDWYGLAFEDKRREILIPHLPGEPPAFAIYHYARADDDESRPLDTLGRIRWTIQQKELPAGGKQTVSFSTDVPEFGVRLTKVFSIEPASYHLGLSIRVEKLPGTASVPKFRYQLAGARGLPIEGEWYATTYRNAYVGLLDSRDVIYRLMADGAGLSRTAGSERFRKDNNRFAYAAVAVQYFASAIAVDDRAEDGTVLPADKMGFLQFARATVEASPVPTKPFLDDITVRTITEPLDLAPGTSAEHRYLLYHGPIKIRQLDRFTGDKAVSGKLIDRYADTLKLSSLTDYGNFGFWTNAIVIVTNLIHKIIGFLTKFLPSGIAIMVVTVIVRGMMFPVSKRQATSMQRMQDKMQKLAPEMKEIEKKYKDDFLGKQQAQRELYKKHNVNPAAGLSGCLMLMLQMPIFMGLYYALQESAFFRLQPFLWIRNLAAPDMLLWWGETVPWLTRQDAQGMICYLGPYLNLLPLIGATLIFVQQKLSMPAEMSEEQKQQYNIMKYMTGFMALMFYRVPAGLSLYFICSSLWGLSERKLVKKLIADEKKKIADLPSRSMKDGPKGKPQPPAPPSRFQQWWQQLLKDASKK
jgi:YidC/Oxa1 family membrane protein insertase